MPRNGQNSKKVRGILTKMLMSVGFGRSGTTKSLGVGDPPLGWPQHISWEDYNGATRSHLNKEEVTDIIVNLLRAAHRNPDAHVVAPELPNEEAEENEEVALEDDEPVLDIGLPREDEEVGRFGHIDEDRDNAEGVPQVEENEVTVGVDNEVKEDGADLNHNGGGVIYIDPTQVNMETIFTDSNVVIDEKNNMVVTFLTHPGEDISESTTNNTDGYESEEGSKDKKRKIGSV